MDVPRSTGISSSVVKSLISHQEMQTKNQLMQTKMFEKMQASSFALQRIWFAHARSQPYGIPLLMFGGTQIPVPFPVHLDARNALEPRRCLAMPRSRQSRNEKLTAQGRETRLPYRLKEHDVGHCIYSRFAPNFRSDLPTLEIDPS